MQRVVRCLQDIVLGLRLDDRRGLPVLGEALLPAVVGGGAVGVVGHRGLLGWI